MSIHFARQEGIPLIGSESTILSNSHALFQEDKPFMRLFLSLFLLLIGMFFPCCAPAEDAPLPATISQQDARFSQWMYQGVSYSAGGCGPSSVTNALLTVLNVTDEDVAAQVAEEMLLLLCSPYDPAVTDMTIGRLAKLDTTALEDLARYPTLDALMRAYPGQVTYLSDEADASALTGWMEPGVQQLIICSLDRTNRWQRLCEMTDLLYRGGFADSTITLSHISAGNIETAGAFRSGRSGHYVSLHVPVREFTEEGAFYLLDSLPRALEGEAYGDGEIYRQPYDFLTPAGRAAGMRPFLASLLPQRLSPTLIRLVPQGDALEAFSAALQAVDPADATTFTALDDARIACLKTTQLMGSSVLFINLIPDEAP